MTPVTISPSRVRRWLVPVALALALSAAAQAAAAEPWLLEPIGASEGVHELHDLGFDADGRALLSWDARARRARPAGLRRARRARPRRRLGAPPEPRGRGRRERADPPALAGPRAARRPRGRSGGPGTPPDRRRRRARPTAASATLRSLAAFTARSWSASNASGDAIVAWTSERNPFVTVSERRDGRGFSRPRDKALTRALTAPRSAAVAINARGDRLLAWPDGRRLAARVRLAGAVVGRDRALRAPAVRSRSPAVGARHRGRADARDLGPRPRPLRRRGARRRRQVARAPPGAALRPGGGRPARGARRAVRRTRAARRTSRGRIARAARTPSRWRAWGRAARSRRSSCRASAARCSTTRRPARATRSRDLGGRAVEHEPAAHGDVRRAAARDAARSRSSGCRPRPRSSRAAAASRFTR